VTSPPTVETLTRDLVGLGVRRGDLLMVHASLRSVGATSGGPVAAADAAGLITALEHAVGPDGTLLVNIGVDDDRAWVNEHPEHERAALLDGADPFEHRRTPADPDNGVLAEVFRTLPGTEVSDHPEGRFAARGPLARVLTADVPWDDYYGADSPLERFVRRRGRVLRLGADIDTVTLLHLAEHLVPIAAKRRVRRHRLVTGEHGPVIRVIETLDDSEGIVERPPGAPDYFGVILHAYLGTGRALVGRVGNATSELIDGADLVDVAVAWMAAHL